MLVRRRRLVLAAVAASLLLGLVAIGSPPAGAIGESVSIGDATIAEGTGAGTTNLVFTITSNQAAFPLPVSIDWATSDGSAKAGSDYTASMGTANIPIGQTSTTISVPITRDPDGEPNDQFTVTLTGSSASIADSVGIGTITNDDGAPPEISIADNTGPESSALGFTLTLSHPTGQAVEVHYITQAESALSPDDFAPAEMNTTFPPNVTEQFVSIPLVDDALDEGPETFFVKLDSPNNAVLGDATATGTITDNDGPPSVSIGNVTQAEGDVGTTAFQFPVTLSAPSGLTATVNFTTLDGTASAGSDYAAGAGTVVFNPGETMKTADVQVSGNEVVELDELFTVNLSSPTNATLNDASADGTITNDDGLPELSIADQSIVEGNAGEQIAELTVTLDRASDLPITVDYDSSDGTTEAGTDYTAVSDSLSFPPGSVSQTIEVPVLGDLTDEADEYLFVTLTDPSGAALNDDTGELTIVDNDGAPGIAIADTSASENDPTAVFTVTLTPASGQTVTVEYNTSNGTALAGSDYTSANGTLTFDPGVTQLAIPIGMLQNTTNEAPETFTVVLQNPNGAALADASATGTINDDDPGPSISVADPVAVSEGNGGNKVLNFSVTLDKASDQAVSVHAHTVNATAGAPLDYTAINDVFLTFSPGQTSKNVAVTIKGDTFPEANETFNVVLDQPVVGTIADGTAVGTILNDDGAPQQLSINDIALAEGDGTTTNFAFTITASAPATQDITFDYATNDGTAHPPADFTEVTGTATILTGQTSVQVVVPVIADTLDEDDETFRLKLLTSTNSSIGDGNGQATIQDDDDPPTVSVGDAAVVEGDVGVAKLMVPVELSNASSFGDITVKFTTLNGSATSGVDYVAITDQVVTFNPGQTLVLVPVDVLGEKNLEPDETFTANLSAPVGATVGDGQGTETITADDTVVFTIDDESASENLGTATFTVMVDETPDIPVSVEYTTAPGTALAGTDYTTTTGTATILAGNTTVTISIPLTQDQLYEGDETFTVEISEPSFGSIGDDTGDGTIVDDDPAPTVSLGKDANVAEGTGITDTTVPVTGTLSKGAGVDFTVDLVSTDGTAVAPGDFTAVVDTFVIPAGTKSVNRSVTVIADNAQEANESFSLTATLQETGDTDDGTVNVSDDDADGTYTSLTPSRVLDTRTGVGHTGKVGQGETIVLDVTGVGGLPTSGLTSVVLNATVTGATADSFLSVTPSGGQDTSNLNFEAGQTIANLVTVAVGVDGNIRIYNASGSVHVLADVVGYYRNASNPTPGSHYVPLTPARIVDTRTGIGGRDTPLGDGETAPFTVTGVGSVPATGVSAVVVNVTVTGTTETSFLSVTPAGGSTTSDQNWTTGVTIPHLSIVEVAPNGTIRVYNDAGTAELLVDVVGYFAAPGTIDGATFVALTPPGRQFDTRTGANAPALGDQEDRTVDVTGTGGVPSTGVFAVVMNLTAVGPSVGTFLSATPAGGSATSSLNVGPGVIQANLAIVPVGPGGNVHLYNDDGTTHVIVDAAGYFV